MKASLLVAVCLFVVPLTGFSQSSSENMSEDLKKELTEQLASIKDSAGHRKTRLIQAVIAALTPAAASDSEALKLFERCLKKVEFDDKGKKDKDWREWLSENKEELSSPANRKALRFQIQWALITLKAGMEEDGKHDPLQYAAQGAAMIGEILKDPKLVSDSTYPFSSSVVDGAIGKMYELSACRRDDWPDDIMDARQVIEGLALKPCRDRKDYAGLRKWWNVMIGLEKMKFDIQAKHDRLNVETTFDVGKRNGPYMFISGNTVENLAWAREVDCFQCGEKVTAAGNMMGMIKATKNTRLQENYADTLVALLAADDPGRKEKVRVEAGYGVAVEKITDNSRK